MNIKLAVSAVLLLLLATSCVSYKILGLFPHPGLSHFHFFHPIMRGLAEAGHDVTVVSHFPDKSPPAHYKDLVLTGTPTLLNAVELSMVSKHGFYSHFFEFFMLYEWGKQSCNLTLKSSALQTILKQKHKVKYDVILIEQFNTDCMSGVAHILGAPVIALSSCAMMPWHYERMANPMNPSYIPALFMGQNEEMNFFGRLGNWITFHAFRFMYKYYNVPAADALVRHKFGQETPSVDDLAKDTSLYFVNQHYSLSGAKPLSPQVIELGGIHIQHAKNIDVDIQKFLDSAEHGVVYISWGSMIRADSLPVAKRDSILRAIRRLKQKVIWKWENDTILNQPDNLLISKWLPQREILCHPNVKVFMSHGGLMGTSEAAYCGTPVVVTPMYGDQFLNSAALVQRGMGVIMKYEDIAENTVIKSVRTVMEKRYVDNAKAVSYSYKNRPKKSLETAIWWVEHVARTEGANLTKSTATYLPGIVYNCIDIYLFILFIAFTVYLFYKILIKTLFKRTKKVKQN